MDRRRLLQELINMRFGRSQADFARAIKRSPAQVHQWLSGHRKLGDAGARLIEQALGLPGGYFDKPLERTTALICAEPPVSCEYLPALTDDEQTIINGFRLLGEEMREAWLDQARKKIAQSTSVKNRVA